MNRQQEKEFDKYLKKYKINCGGIAKRMIWRYFSKIQQQDRAKYIKELEEICSLIKKAKRGGTSMSRRWHKIDEIDQAFNKLIKALKEV